MIDRLLALGLVLLAAALVAGFAYAIYDAVSWPDYAAEHHCRETGRTRERTGYHHYHVGKAMMMVPYTYTQDEWICDGNEGHWR